MLFKDIPGHKQLKDKLIGSVQSNRLGHALLLLGPEGSGALPLALALAQYVNCTDRRSEDSCGECASCRKAGAHIHPDINYTYPVVTKKAGKPPLSTDYITEWREAIRDMPHMNAYGWLQHIGAENKQGNITVDECRQIIRRLSLKPFEGQFKVQIIWMAEYLKAAGNVLLKVIEEPPGDTLFILIAEQSEDLLQTLISRTQVHPVGKFTEAEVLAYLKETFEIAEADAQYAARVADGNMHLAVSLAQEGEAMEIEDFNRWLQILLALADKKRGDRVNELMAWVDEMSRIGREKLKIFLKYSLFYLRESMLSSLGMESRLADAERKAGVRWIEHLDVESMHALQERIDDMYYYIERNAHPKMMLLHHSLEIARSMEMRPQASKVRSGNGMR